MNDLKVLVTCAHVWDAEGDVRARFAAHGVDVDMPRFEGQQLEEVDLLPIIDRYDGIVAGDDHLTAKVLEAASSLKVISKWGIGTDAIDLDAAKRHGIKVFNTPGVFGEELADYAMGYIHMLARRQHDVNQLVKAGEWPKIRGVSLAGKVLGVLGLGSSGRALARRGLASSMEVLGHEIADIPPVSGVESVGFEELLRRSDVVSVHVPLTPETKHTINEYTLSQMKAGAWLVNTSRGPLVDEAALVAALESGHLGAAALDVFETEPVSPENPLLRMGNVIAGAHNGSNTEQAVQRTTWRAVNNVLEGLGLVEAH